MLEPAKIASKQWETDSTPTIHLVVREVFNMQGMLDKYEKSTDKYIASFAKELKNNVDQRFQKFATDTLIYSVAHMAPYFRSMMLITMFTTKQRRKYFDWDPGKIQSNQMKMNLL